MQSRAEASHIYVWRLALLVKVQHLCQGSLPDVFLVVVVDKNLDYVNFVFLV